MWHRYLLSAYLLVHNLLQSIRLDLLGHVHVRTLSNSVR
jgi:hypothetical protein